MVPLFSTLSSIAKHPCLRCWRREKSWCSKSATETARNANRGYLRDTVVKTFGSIYNEFLPTKICNIQENGVREAHEVPTRQGARPTGGGGGLLSRGSLVSLSDYFFLPKILKYSKTDKNCHWSCFGVGLLTVPHTYSFSESGTFWNIQSYVFLGGYGFNNISFNIDRIT